MSVKEGLCVAESAGGRKEGEDQSTLYVFYLYIYICHIYVYMKIEQGNPPDNV
jgi:hypothetical protein